MDEIVSAQGRLMDWAQAMTAFGAGAAGVLAIQQVIRNLNKKPADKPLDNGERRGILLQLIKLEQMGLNQEVSIQRIDGRLDAFEDRLRIIERAYSRVRSQEYPTQGSTD